MPTLHGSWILAPASCSFFLWSETWRPPIGLEEGIHPYCLSQDALSQSFNWEQNWSSLTLSLPSRELPLLSGQVALESLPLKPWRVEGFNLTPHEAIAFLASLPLNSLPQENEYIGEDLRFWCHIYRWSLDLLVRRKFIPGIIEQTPETLQTLWQPLLDNTIDQARLAKFTRLMPRVCSQYEPNQSFSSQVLLLSALITLVDVQIRHSLDSSGKWLQTIFQKQATFSACDQDLQSLKTTLHNWTLPRQEYIVSNPNYQLGQNQFRLCLVLTPPLEKTEDWRLAYSLQALDAPELRLDGATIWRHPVSQLLYQGRIIEQPQETLLKGLGLAARLFPPIRESLEEKQPVSCTLSYIQVYEFIGGLAQELQNNGLGVILPPGLDLVANKRRLGLKITAKVNQKKGQNLSLKSLLDYQIAITIGSETISQGEFEELLEARSPFVQFKGEWIALQPGDVRAAQEILSPSHQKTSLSVTDAIRLSAGDSQPFGKLPVVEFAPEGILQELLDYINNNQSLAIVAQPSAFIGELRPYQLRGLSWLSFLERWGFGACLADDMGLGKTPQLLAFLLHLKAQKRLLKPSLVICPTSVLNNWQREAQKFAPSLTVLVHHGDKRALGKEWQRRVSDFDLVLTSYSLLYRDQSTLEGLEWQVLALDEAQNLKNSSTKQSQSARQLKADFRVALTGTPVENRLSELWSIVDLVNPGWLGNRQFFQTRFATPIEKQGDEQSLQTLRSLISPFMLRRLKTDPEIRQDLPEKQEMNVFCSLSTEQAELYQKVVEESLNQIETSSGITRRATILTLLLKLKQICNHPAQFLKAKSLGSSERSGKLLRLEEMLEELIIAGDRALIFTQFAQWGKLLQAYLSAKFNTDALFLYGATRRDQRQEMIDRFQNDPNGPPIFILSLKAGGTGLNLTRANHVFHIDRWWNPAVENQATDRAFRLGQTRNVQVHKFICTGTLEERIHEMIEKKKELATQTVAAGEDWLTELDTNQLRDLLLLDRDAVIES
ncbi:DEAD/DEAH box helicase [Gloeocapsa sp. PCC 73106]|uniref:DEAD/DEAH box helicase n=1 Tax=Gloeocapsa sp. PCC 73106 TaxID=102232 RepID=UPI0002AC8444|nr:DEAD/DEAH box helicase [Gloeocapsa sp. PCC 73106]ELR96981.1 DNA/RNA helicase, superfamily II, SNF2 family [Gloeocapsa sp. PCC 73106]